LEAILGQLDQLMTNLTMIIEGGVR